MAQRKAPPAKIPIIEGNGGLGQAPSAEVVAKTMAAIEAANKIAVEHQRIIQKAQEDKRVAMAAAAQEIKAATFKAAENVARVQTREEQAAEADVEATTSKASPMKKNLKDVAVRRQAAAAARKEQEREDKRKKSIAEDADAAITASKSKQAAREEARLARDKAIDEARAGVAATRAAAREEKRLQREAEKEERKRKHGKPQKKQREERVEKAREQADEGRKIIERKTKEQIQLEKSEEKRKKKKRNEQQRRSLKKSAPSYSRRSGRLASVPSLVV